MLTMSLDSPKKKTNFTRFKIYAQKAFIYHISQFKGCINEKITGKGSEKLYDIILLSFI